MHSIPKSLAHRFAENHVRLQNPTGQFAVVRIKVITCVLPTQAPTAAISFTSPPPMAPTTAHRRNGNHRPRAFRVCRLESERPRKTVRNISATNRAL
jgi:hypothetical protein